MREVVRQLDVRGVVIQLTECCNAVSYEGYYHAISCEGCHDAVRNRVCHDVTSC